MLCVQVIPHVQAVSFLCNFAPPLPLSPPLVLRNWYRNSESMGGETCCHLLVLQISAALGRKPVISAGGSLCPLGVTTPGLPPSLVLGVLGREGLIR